jgi:alpha-beta hydrolase superfamily lysophospholipase
MAINAASESNSIGPARRVIVLVHGSWCYAPIGPLLAAKGIAAEAFDLPGCGLTAKPPQSYRTGAFNASKFSSEQSPVDGVT